VITLGLILLIVGFVVAIPVLETVGIILLLVGLVLWFVPGVGGGRRWY
jgi:hypothetical protein